MKQAFIRASNQARKMRIERGFRVMGSRASNSSYLSSYGNFCMRFRHFLSPAPNARFLYPNPRSQIPDARSQLGSLEVSGGLLWVSRGYPCLEHEIHAKVLIFHWYYKQTVIWAKTNVAGTLVLETSAKIMLLWPQNGARPHHRSAATATLFRPMSLKPAFWQHLFWPKSRFAHKTSEKSILLHGFHAPGKDTPQRPPGDPRRPPGDPQRPPEAPSWDLASGIWDLIQKTRIRSRGQKGSTSHTKMTVAQRI